MREDEIENKNKPWTNYPKAIEEALRERRAERQDDRYPTPLRVNMSELLRSPRLRREQDELVQRLKAENPCLEPFEGRDAVRAFLLDRAQPSATKTSILLTLMREHQRATGPSAALGLLVWSFYPLLVKIDREVAGRVAPQDENDAFARLVAAFTESVNRYPAAGESTAVAYRLEMATRKRFLVAYEREQRGPRTERRFREKAMPHIQELERWGSGSQSNVLARMASVSKEREEPPPPDDDEISKAHGRLEALLHGRKLRPGQRRLLVLVYGCGWTFEEACALLRVKLESSKRWAAREIKRIREANPHFVLGDVPENDETDTF